MMCRCLKQNLRKFGMSAPYLRFRLYALLAQEPVTLDAASISLSLRVSHPVFNLQSAESHTSLFNFADSASLNVVEKRLCLPTYPLRASLDMTVAECEYRCSLTSCKSAMFSWLHSSAVLSQKPQNRWKFNPYVVRD